MTAQTSIQQRATQSGSRVDLRASPSAAQDTSQPQPVNVSQASGEAQGERDGTGNVNTAKVAGVSLLVAGAAIIVAVFAAGFMRTRVERGFRRLFRRIADSAEEIEVPLLLPLTIAEVIREVLTDRRVMTPPSGEQPAMN